MSEKPENMPNTTIDNSTPVPAEQAAVVGELSEQELSMVTGGGGSSAAIPFLAFTFKLVAVKTIS